MGCWFEFKRKRVFFGCYFGQLYLNSVSVTERRTNITFYLKRRSLSSRNFKRTKNVKFCFALFAMQYFSRYWAEFKRWMVNFWMMFDQSLLNLLRPCYWKEDIWKILFKRRAVLQMSKIWVGGVYAIQDLSNKTGVTPGKKIDEDVVFSFLFKNELFVVLEENIENMYQLVQRQCFKFEKQIMFCLFYILRARLRCSFEFRGSLLFILNDDQVHSTFLQEEPITSNFVLIVFAIDYLWTRAVSHLKRALL